MFAHSRSKTITHWWFRALFATVSVQQKEVLHKYVTMDESRSTTSLCSQIGSQLSGQQQLKVIQSNQSQILYSIIGSFEGRNCQKMATKEEENVLFHQDNAPCQKLIAMMAKLHELHFKLLPHPLYSLDLAPSAYRKLRCILKPKTNCSTKKALNC